MCVEQKLSGSHKALVEMQDDVLELMKSAVKEYPASKVSLSECLEECVFVFSQVAFPFHDRRLPPPTFAQLPPSVFAYRSTLIASKKC